MAKAAINTENDDFLECLFKTVTNVSRFPIKPVMRMIAVRCVHNFDEILFAIRIVELSYLRHWIHISILRSEVDLSNNSLEMNKY